MKLDKTDTSDKNLNEAPKIVFLDIDGTLIDIAHGLRFPSENTKRVLMNFKQQGHLLVAASSRGIIPECLKGIDFDGMILCDGHYVEFASKVLINDLFTSQEIEHIQTVTQDTHAAACYTGHFGDWYANHEQTILRNYMIYFDFETDVLITHDFNWKAHEIKANCVTAIFNSVDDLYDAKARLPQTWSIIAYETKPYRMDIYPAGHSKGSACEYLFNHLNIKHENTYAFGDGINDLEMLQLVGHGIAMGNASEIVKSHADDVTDSVLHDGIEKAFNKYFGKKE